MAFRGAHEDTVEPHLRTTARLRQPTWATAALTAALLISGFNRHRAPAASWHERSLRLGISDEQARGRYAAHPAEIPTLGWRDIFVRAYRNVLDDRIIALGAGVTFYGILAIFPALAALVSVYGLFADPSIIQRDIHALSSVLPPGVIDVVGEQMRRLTSRGPTTLGATFAGSLVFSLWSANSGIQSLFDALNIVYHEKEKRSYPKLYAVSFAFTLAGLGFSLVAIALIAVLPVALSYLPLGAETATLLSYLRWPIMLVLIALAIATFYRFGPSRETAQWRWVTGGSLLASVLWLAASILFSWYTTSLASYDKTYGSLGTIIIFMTWVWISNIVILLGAELDAEIEHQTMQDTTSGPPRPMGERGAHVADTIGAPQD
jgi:membrane protein